MASSRVYERSTIHNTGALNYFSQMDRIACIQKQKITSATFSSSEEEVREDVFELGENLELS